MSDKNILLVEGESDRGLLEALCKKWHIPVGQVKVCTPRDAGHAKNSKQAVWAVLPIYLAQLADGQIEKLALVVDADSPPNGGFDRTLSQLQPLLAQHGYQGLADKAAPGLRFTHADGLPEVGAWVMPNNTDPGMVEDWLKNCLHADEADLMRHAQQAIASLPVGLNSKPCTAARPTSLPGWHGRRNPATGFTTPCSPGCSMTMPRFWWRCTAGWCRFLRQSQAKQRQPRVVCPDWKSV